jgi:hypothetical protein
MIMKIQGECRMTNRKTKRTAERINGCKKILSVFLIKKPLPFDLGLQ